MGTKLKFNSLLAPVDLAGRSRVIVERALDLLAGDAPSLILMHVLDPLMVDFATDHGWGSHDEIVAQMRRHAERDLETYRELAPAEVEMATIVSEGVPFLEILRKSEDFAVDAIVMGKVERHVGI